MDGHLRSWFAGGQRAIVDIVQRNREKAATRLPASAAVMNLQPFLSSMPQDDRMSGRSSDCTGIVSVLSLVSALIESSNIDFRI
jgi:hypothetical protein